MGAVRRRRAHAAVGAELEREPEGQRRPATDLAFHFARAGDREGAVRYALEAAAEAERATAFAQAASHYRSAAALLEGSPEAASLPEVLVRLGDVSGRAGSYSTAAETFRRAIDLLGQPGGNPRMAEVEIGSARRSGGRRRSRTHRRRSSALALGPRDRRQAMPRPGAGALAAGDPDAGSNACAADRAAGGDNVGHAQVREVLRQLQARKRQFLVLRLYLDLPWSDVAAAARLTEAGARTRYYRALKRLRRRVALRRYRRE